MNWVPFLVLGLLLMAATVVGCVVVFDPPPEFTDPPHGVGPWCQIDRISRLPDDDELKSGTWTVTSDGHVTLFREYEGKPWTIQNIKVQEPPRSVAAFGSTVYIADSEDRVYRYEPGSGPRMFASGPVKRIEVFGPTLDDIWIQFENDAIYCGKRSVTRGVGVDLGRVNGNPVIHDGAWTYVFGRCSGQAELGSTKNSSL